MLGHISDQVLAALARLNATQDFQTVLTFLDGELKDTDERMRIAFQIEELRRLQGKAQTLDAFIAISREAHKIRAKSAQ